MGEGDSRRVPPWARGGASAALLLLAAFVLVYLWPVLVGGKVLSPAGVLYAFPPWGAYAPATVDDYFNSVLIDVPTQMYPWRWLIRELLHEGTFPAWNPHVFAGTPLYANPQTGLFSLFSLPQWTLPFNYALGVSAALKLCAGAFGMYLLMRELRLGFLPGVLAGVCFAFCSFNVVWLTHESLPAVAVMLPWVVWLVERALQGGGLGCVLGLAAVTAIGLGGGHPGTQVHMVTIAGLYALLRAALLVGVPRRGRLRALGVACAGLALGVLLMGFLLIPELLTSHETVGAAVRSHGGSTLPGSELPLGVLRTVAFPDWWGRPNAFQVRTDVNLNLNYNERTFYAGAVALLLAALALLERGAWRSKAPFVALGVIGLAVPLHAPGLHWLATHLPALDRVQSQRLHLAFAFAVAALAAFGLQGLLERPRGARWRLLVPLGALAVAAAAFAFAGAQPGDVGRTLRHFLSGTDFARAGVVALTSVAWFALFALAVGVALVVAHRWSGRARAVAAALVLLAMLDAYHFARGYQPMVPAGDMPRATPAIAYVQQHAAEGRMVGLGAVLPNDWALTYRLDDVRGYDPPQPTQRFYRLWQRANPTQVPWQPFWIRSLTAEAVRVVSLLGARYVVAAPDVTGAPLDDRVLRPLTRVYAGQDASVLLNPNAVPRALVASSVELVADEQQALQALTAPSFDPRRSVVVERDQPGVSELAGERPHGDVAVVQEQNARVTLSATLSGSGLVVLNDDWSDGWTVRVDGDPAVPLRVNDVMRGVIVGAGRHEVEWRYAVPGLRAGAVASLLALALLLAGLVVHVRRARGRAASGRVVAPVLSPRAAEE